jgi:hypothetical protein
MLPSFAVITLRFAALGTLLGPDISEGDSLGCAVAVHAQCVLAGALADDDQGSNAGSAYSFLLPSDAPLVGCPLNLSVATGGVQQLALDAGAAHAGKLYFVLGSLSGSSPGFVFDGLTIPLNVDDYFLLTLTRPGASPLSSSLGVLSASGTATASLTLPQLGPAAVGLRVHHAAVAGPFFTYGPLEFASNAAPLYLKP